MNLFTQCKKQKFFFLETEDCIQKLHVLCAVRESQSQPTFVTRYGKLLQAQNQTAPARKPKKLHKLFLLSQDSQSRPRTHCTKLHPHSTPTHFHFGPRHPPPTIQTLKRITPPTEPLGRCRPGVSPPNSTCPPSDLDSVFTHRRQVTFMTLPQRQGRCFSPALPCRLHAPKYSTHTCTNPSRPPTP